MRGTYTGTLPLNSRITIDYTSGKVKFKYPNRNIGKRSALFGSIGLLGSSFLIFWILLGTIIYIPIVYLVPGTANWYFLWILIPVLSLSLITGINTKFRILYYPKIMALVYSTLLGYYRMSFHKTKHKIVEVTGFRNVFLNYKATGEFAKNLEKVEIKEYGCKTHLWGGIRRNVTFWKAQFIFKKNCTRGKLDVVFL